MRVSFKNVASVTQLTTDALILPFFSDTIRRGIAAEADKLNGRCIQTAIKREDFSGKAGDVLVIPCANHHKTQRLVLWGLGDKNKIDAINIAKQCEILAAKIHSLNISQACIAFDLPRAKGLKSDWLCCQLGISLSKGEYHYKTTKPSQRRSNKLKSLSIVGIDASPALRRAAKKGTAIGQGINLARELGNLPGNICTPKFLTSEARKLGRKYNTIKVSVLNETRMEALGMHSLLSVSAGSEEPAQLICMEYNGGKRKEAPEVLVGKGITFDTGGISLKPGAKMDEMKFDMCGAASVFGTIQSIAEMQLPINVVGVVAAAENMPSGRATKPGDVVTSMSGKTIEILNTDAEGRLVLCDALTYIARYKPANVIDIATLTGACIVALGHHASGLISNDDELANALLTAGQESADRAWRLPLWDNYQKQLDSEFADIANIGGPAAGTITAGCFLSRFTENYRWAHLDIAGTAWNQGGKKGASGRPVSLLCQYLIDRAENS